MKLGIIKPPQFAAPTLIDVLIVIATLAIAAAILVPRLTRPKVSNRLGCAINLKQIGLAMRMWSNEHGDKFPWAVAETNGGTMEYATSPEVFRHFLAASNELNAPRMLACPQDVGRPRINSFACLKNNNLSYFVGLDADETKPNTILSGDRSLSTNRAMLKGLLVLKDPKTATWAPGIHQKCGNLGLGDGSAQEFTTPDLQKFLAEKVELPARVSLP